MQSSEVVKSWSRRIGYFVVPVNWNRASLCFSEIAGVDAVSCDEPVDTTNEFSEALKFDIYFP